MSDLDYLRERLEAAVFVPFPWDGEDQNLRAFRSKEELIAWYCQPPGVEGQPYRDRGFYTRELAMLSRLVGPCRIVEFGTSLGIGTCLLRWLNPDAHLTTVDVNTETFLPGDRRVEMGYLALLQGVECYFATCNSWEYDTRIPADLWFIDGDHSFDAVRKDSILAWANTPDGRPWAIAWHDHNERHPGVMGAVEEFCRETRLKLQSLPDSDTVWVWEGVE